MPTTREGVYRFAGEMLGILRESLSGGTVSLEVERRPELGVAFRFAWRFLADGTAYSVEECVAPPTIMAMRFPEVHAKCLAEKWNEQQRRVTNGKDFE